jgi:hypothetical protein
MQHAQQALEAFRQKIEQSRKREDELEAELRQHVLLSRQHQQDTQI